MAGLLFALLGCYAAGCGGAKCPTQPHRNPEAALASVSGAKNSLRTLRAEASVTQWGPKGRVRGSVWMLLERPDRIRFDAMTPLGPVATLTSDGKNFQLTDMRERLFVEGEPCASNVGRLLGVRLSAAEAARLLFGDVPRIEAGRRSIMCREDGGYRIELFGKTGEVEVVDLDVRKEDLERPPKRQRLRVVAASLRDSNGQVKWRARFDDFTWVKDRVRPKLGFFLAHKVHIEDVVRGTEVSMRFRSIEANIPLDGHTFQQKVGAGLTKRVVSCVDAAGEGG